jgi:hypothetical protein
MAMPPSRLVRASLRTSSYYFQIEPVRRIARRLEPVRRIRPSSPCATARAARTRTRDPRVSRGTYVLMYPLDCYGAQSATHTKCILYIAARVHIYWNNNTYIARYSCSNRFEPVRDVSHLRRGDPASIISVSSLMTPIVCTRATIYPPLKKTDIGFFVKKYM